MNNPLRVAQTESVLLPDGFLAVSHAAKSLSFVMPPLGGLVWELCDGDHSVAQIVQEIFDMASEHGAPPANLAEDVHSLLKKLGDAGLLEANQESSS